ncbi:Crp/Fnr family transcriptional regulator [Paludibacter sp.]
MEIKRIITENFIEFSVPKNEHLIQSGETENYLYYLEKGICRYYLYNLKDDSEQTFDFAYSGDFFCSYESFRKRQPSKIYIQSLSVSKVYKIHYKSLLDLLSSDIKYYKIALKIIDGFFINKINREISLLKDSPETIYQNLIKREPYLILNVPLKHISSYIGITPQALSRIRNRIS